MDKRSKPAGDNKPLERWEQLYNMKGKTKEDIEKLKKKYDKSDPVIAGCTFKPTILSSETDKKGNVDEVRKRSLLWDKQKETKIQKKRDLICDEELKGCTFKPSLIDEMPENDIISEKALRSDKPELPEGIPESSMK